jgi:hypothetical protein
MVEFPGSTYHCHILPHEENMMMRPMMFQYSDAYLARLSANTNQCAKANWLETYQCINSKINC